MKLRNIITTLKAEVLNNSADVDVEIRWACATDLMSEVLYYSKEKSILLTALANAQAVRTADIADIDVIVFTRGKGPDAETVELARRKNIALLITHLSLFSAAGKLYEAGLRCCPDTQAGSSRP